MLTLLAQLAPTALSLGTLWGALFLLFMVLWLITFAPRYATASHPIAVALLPWLAVLFGVLWAHNVGAAIWHGYPGR